MADLAPPQQLNEFHTSFAKAIEHCADAYGAFASAVGRDFAIRFLKGRFLLCRGKQVLYRLRADLPLLQQYWVLPEALPELARLESQSSDLDVPVGLIRKEQTEQRYAYSLYVPENYAAENVAAHRVSTRRLQSGRRLHSDLAAPGQEQGLLAAVAQVVPRDLVGHSHAGHAAQPGRRSALHPPDA